MSWLYTDTTDHLIFGLVSKDLEWLDYIEIHNKKSSSELHFLVNDMLKKHDLEAKEISGHLFAAGPGSYTGMRVSEGMAQVFEWQNIDVYSFYHYEIPEILEAHEGIWVSEAFKGEYFVYNLMAKDYQLYIEKDFIDLINSENCSQIYTHFYNEKMKSVMGDKQILSTGAIIKDTPKLIFDDIINSNKRRNPMYYRAEEKEFKASK